MRLRRRGAGTLPVVVNITMTNCISLFEAKHNGESFVSVLCLSAVELLSLISFVFIAIMRYWPQVSANCDWKKVYSMSCMGSVMFSLFLFGRKQTRLELNQTLAKKKKLNKNCGEEPQYCSLSVYWSSNSSGGLWWADSQLRITTVATFLYFLTPSSRATKMD